jgi:Putative auto-transporter adhesin, head GIN domain
MKLWLGLATSVTAVAVCGAAAAADVDIRHAAARVTVTPEARSDIAVSVYKSNSRLPIRVYRQGDTVVVDGGLGLRGPNCASFFGRKGVHIWGVGFTPYDALPQVMIRTPMAVKVKASGAVFGAVGRSDSLQLANAGCGDWTVANVTGPADVRVAGSGDVHAGAAGSAEVRISGSSDISFNAIRNGLVSSTSGSGDLRAGAVNGPMHVRIAGSGDVVAHGGQVTDMSVELAGSGDVRFAGVAQSLQAAIAGSGDVTVGRVTGPVTKHVAGSGSVTVGS